MLVYMEDIVLKMAKCSLFVVFVTMGKKLSFYCCSYLFPSTIRENLSLMAFKALDLNRRIDFKNFRRANPTGPDPTPNRRNL